MLRPFKYLKVLTAIILILCATSGFIGQLESQSNALLDGPLAHPMSYAFALNKITLVALLGVVLIFDFKFILPIWGKRFLRIFGLICIILSLIGFIFLIQQHLSMTSAWLLFSDLYIFQTAYLMVSCTLFAKSFDKHLSADHIQRDSNA